MNDQDKHVHTHIFIHTNKHTDPQAYVTPFNPYSLVQLLNEELINFVVYAVAGLPDGKHSFANSLVVEVQGLYEDYPTSTAPGIRVRQDVQELQNISEIVTALPSKYSFEK